MNGQMCLINSNCYCCHCKWKRLSQSIVRAKLFTTILHYSCFSFHLFHLTLTLNLFVFVLFPILRFSRLNWPYMYRTTIANYWWGFFRIQMGSLVRQHVYGLCFKSINIQTMIVDVNRSRIYILWAFAVFDRIGHKLVKR